MMEWGANLLLVFAAAGVVILVGSVFKKWLLERDEGEEPGKDDSKRSEGALRELELEHQSRLLDVRRKFEEQLAEERKDNLDFQRQIIEREAQLEERRRLLEQERATLNLRGEQLDKETNRIEEAERRLSQQRDELESRLEETAQLTKEEARERVIAAVTREAEELAQEEILKRERLVKAESHLRATKILAQAMQRQAASLIVENGVTTVALPSDDMKGRIIGREGRNIRTLENLTGVDIIIDDTPDVIVLSAFSSKRRFIAKRIIELLVEDGRIHPSRIEEIAGRVNSEIDEETIKFGERACRELDLHTMHPELVRHVGHLRFAEHEGHNLLQHSLETGNIASVMAAELDLNTSLARRIGLLHDIGRIAESGLEGSHAEVAAQIADRYNESNEVVTALLQHHDEMPNTVMGCILQCADALSRERPGARREEIGDFVERLQAMEDLALNFSGVRKAHVIKYGKELRVMVHASEVGDQSALLLSGKIASRVEDSLRYPGEVKVTVLRESRVSEVAR